MTPFVIAAAVVAGAVYLALCLALLLVVAVPVALVLGAVAGVAGVVGTCGIVATSLWPAERDRDRPVERAIPPHVLVPGPGTDPAWRHYLAVQGPMDATEATERVRQAVGTLWSGLHRHTVRVLESGWQVLWPLAPVPYVVGVAGTAGVVAAGAIVAVVLGIPVGAWWLVRSAAVRLLRRGDHRRLRRAGSVATCHGCDEVTELPVVECPRCHQAHHQLVPGVYGVFRRRCSCGALLPASAVTIARAPAEPVVLRCPRCDRRLPPGSLTGADVRIVVAGAPGAGAGRVAAAGLDSLAAAVVAAGGTAEALEPPDPAPDLLHAGRSVRVRLGRLQHGTVHVYDAPGAVWDVPSQRRRLHHLAHAQGIVLVIDPTTIPQLAGRLGDDRAGVDPEPCYRRLVGQLRDHRVPVRDRVLAVVVTRADELDERFRGRGPRAGSDGVRDWLRSAGLDNLVLATGRDFGTVRFFLVSAPPGQDSPSAGAVLNWVARRVGLRLPVPALPAPRPPADEGAAVTDGASP